MRGDNNCMKNGRDKEEKRKNWAKSIRNFKREITFSLPKTCTKKELLHLPPPYFAIISHQMYKKQFFIWGVF